MKKFHAKCQKNLRSFKIQYYSREKSLRKIHNYRIFLHLVKFRAYSIFPILSPFQTNRLNVQRSRTEYLMCYPFESLQSDHLHESSRARKLVRNATLLSLISSKLDDTKARRREISHSENSRRKERENDRNEKRVPSLTA